jgi:hypothetical protein
MCMLGKENFGAQCQFLGEMHALCTERIKDTRDTEFTESYLQFVGQLLKTNIELINSSGISLDFMVHFCKCINGVIFVLIIQLIKIMEQIQYETFCSLTVSDRVSECDGNQLDEGSCVFYSYCDGECSEFASVEG